MTSFCRSFWWALLRANSCVRRLIKRRRSSST